jgi:transcription elongation factor B subunit 1
MVASSDKPMSKYVTLVSSEGFEYIVLREVACVSGAIRRMLDPTSRFH